MARSPGDATRFTATGPYASTKAFSPNTTSTIGSRIDFGEAPPNESPQQKIARLRAAAQLAKRGKEDTFDKVVRIGRVWADRAHRATVYSLFGLTVVSFVFGAAGITDMVLHNRARRRDWYNEQEFKRQTMVKLAQQAQANGTATEDQLLLLGQERAKVEAAEAKKNRPGVLKRTSNYVFGGLTKEEQKGGRLGAAAAVATDSAVAATEKTKATFTAAKDTVMEQLDNNSSESIVNVPTSSRSTSATTRQGGVLDQQAQNLVNATKEQGNSWRRWLIRG